MGIERVFHDRRRAPAVEVPLTAQQRELLRRAGAPLDGDERGIKVTAEGHREMVRFADGLEAVAETPHERRVARNLRTKVVSAVVGANPEACRGCNGNGCDRCANTGRRLAG